MSFLKPKLSYRASGKGPGRNFKVSTWKRSVPALVQTKGNASRVVKRSGRKFMEHHGLAPQLVRITKGKR